MKKFWACILASSCIVVAGGWMMPTTQADTNRILPCYDDPIDSGNTGNQRDTAEIRDSYRGGFKWRSLYAYGQNTSNPRHFGDYRRHPYSEYGCPPCFDRPQSACSDIDDERARKRIFSKYAQNDPLPYGSCGIESKEGNGYGEKTPRECKPYHRPYRNKYGCLGARCDHSPYNEPPCLSQENT